MLIPFTGSYPPEDAVFLLKPMRLETVDVAAKERLIQSGQRHYSEMLAPEPAPGSRYLELFEALTERYAARLAGEIVALADHLAIPVVTAWMPDLYPPDQPYYAGRLGTLGTRSGNFAVQNADFILVVGSRLTVSQVSFNWETFAREGYVVSVNIDPAELAKPIAVVDEAVCADPKVFLVELLAAWKDATGGRADWVDWLGWCRERVVRYPEVSDAMREPRASGIHPYHFVETLFCSLEDDAFVACGNAASACVAFQAAPLRLGQRITSNASAGSMGHDLPSAIGAVCARKGRRVICLAGDGSLMMNLQELQTVVYQQFPLGIFVMNNGGYQSIRNTQRNFFGRLMGEGPDTGVAFPDFIRLAEAFGLSAFRLEGEDFGAALEKILTVEGPWLCDVRLDPDVGLEPRASSKSLPDGRLVTAPLEDMFPFLDRSEFLRNMKISPVGEPV